MMKVSKIIAAIFNIICLFATLFIPSDTTLIVSIPVVVAACSWIWGTAAENEARHFRDKKFDTTINAFFAWSIVVLGYTVLVAIFCECFVSQDSQPVLKVRDAVAMLGGTTFLYLWFSLPEFLMVGALYVGELFVPNQVPFQQSICCKIATEIANNSHSSLHRVKD